MADRFWVGGTGNWSDASNHWSDTSGGSPNASFLPTTSDNVFFNANSFSGAGQVVTVDSNANCQNIDWTGATNTPSIAINNPLNVYGNLVFISNMTTSATGTPLLYFKATATGKTITTAGITIAPIVYIDGVGGGWTLQDSFTCSSSFNVRNGTFNSGNQNITATGVSISFGTTRSVTLGSSTVTCTDWTASNVTNLTFNAGTSTIIQQGNTTTFAGGGLTYYKVQLTGTPITISGSNTYTELIGTASKTITITAGTTQTITRLGGVGTSGNLVTFQSSSAGSAYTLTKSSGNFVVNYCSFKDCTVSGTAMTAYNSTNVSGNTNITFSAGSPTAGRYWVVGTGNWGVITSWSSISGGVTGASVPVNTDDVYFDVNSFSGASQTATVEGVATCRSMNWTGATNTPTLAGTVLKTLNIYGSLTFISDMNVTFAGAVNFSSTVAGQTITTAGKFQSLSTYSLTFGGTGGWTLQDSLVISATISVTAGTLNTNNQTVGCKQFSVSGTNTKTITLGTSTVTASDNVSIVATNTTLNANQSTIKMTGTGKTFTGGGLTYYNLEIVGSDCIIAGNNTFNDLKLTENTTVKFTAGSTQTVTTWSGNGNAVNFIVIVSTTPGTFYTINSASGGITKLYYEITDCHVGGGAVFKAYESNDISGNDGWFIISAGAMPVNALKNVRLPRRKLGKQFSYVR